MPLFLPALLLRRLRARPSLAARKRKLLHQHACTQLMPLAPVKRESRRLDGHERAVPQRALRYGTQVVADERSARRVDDAQHPRFRRIAEILERLDELPLAAVNVIAIVQIGARYTRLPEIPVHRQAQRVEVAIAHRLAFADGAMVVLATCGAVQENGQAFGSFQREDKPLQAIGLDGRTGGIPRFKGIALRRGYHRSSNPPSAESRASAPSAAPA